mmetsp:Transcript_2740/g.4118  ORF Transcript_2740/g.4118 Transcript_2740/m.4118 type:complete len:296 (+) Transcript_2740:37-924(+)|eukprot:CAMPEP_0169278408 /NCGR_PEP_ID=MMETSP1016-20121227/54297_1 /TAXON_ID=342587 /ORGANISM="Karlodinium micrum, Strain CCMP2283" /LENGTH=295 /DNA_ID=CAMNT_0009366143 /DNA_START=27 /DNA_END=914 /DNA_ORIENTATION=-
MEPLESLDKEGVHIVLLGDSTLDNGRYLNLARGELSVEKLLQKKCMERGWEMTVLAQDGSMLEDVRYRQLPLIPDRATHIVISATGNDLLSLLNQMVVANFTMSSVYQVIGTRLGQLGEEYRNFLKDLKSMGCHLCVCTHQHPNFNHIFFKTLAIFGLGLHNNRIKTISEELDFSVIDIANMLEGKEDFANPLEMSTRGGSKLVENIDAFVNDHPVTMLGRRLNKDIYADHEAYSNGPTTAFGVPLKCCATRSASRKVYCGKKIATFLETPAEAAAHGPPGPTLEFAQVMQDKPT